MYLKLLINDFKKNTWSNGIILMFISLSVTVIVAVTMLLIQLFTSISSMYEVANPPHFLQLHKGEISQSNLDRFNHSFKDLKYAQTITLINVDGKKIKIFDEKEKQISLEECRLDISFVKQNNIYDVLLGKDREVLELNKGEVAVPIILSKSFDIDIGDRLILTHEKMIREYRVSSYVYDGQMNSTLASSTRFLISDEDFKDLLTSSLEKEYMIEAWFLDKSQASAYQNAYEESSLNLPKNGQAVTYTMIFLLSALTDLMIAMIFLLMGVILMGISLICLRYTILEELEEDMKEIGTMKAIGISQKGICNLYLTKIKIIAFIGSFLGLLIALMVSIAINMHLSDTFGNQGFKIRNLVFAVLVTVMVYAIIILFSKRILKRLLKASIVDLLVTEKGFSKKVRKVYKLRKNKYLSFNFLVSIHKLHEGYGMVFALMLMISFFIMIPFRTVQTMENSEFIHYMGSPVYDLLIDVEQGENLEERNQKLDIILKNELENGNLKQIDILRTVRLQAISIDGEIVGIYISSGKTAGMGLQYLSGISPNKETEIALSYLLSDALKKRVGDSLEVIVEGKKQDFIVSGIYQDITSGGKTAKTIYPFSNVPSEKYSYGIKLNNIKASDITVDLRNRLGWGYSVENMREFLNQTLGNVIMQIKKASYIVFIIGISLSSLIIALFIKLLLTREASALAVKKAMGISLFAIKRQELYPILLSGGMGSFIGVCLGEILGDIIMSGLFMVVKIGLKEFTFVNIPVWQFLVIPFILISILILVGSSILSLVKKIEVMRYINAL